LKLSILNDVLKEMVEAGEKKEQDVWKLPIAPWWSILWLCIFSN
jgi:hypothetical protein